MASPDDKENAPSAEPPRKTLKAAGLSFLLADAALFSYGIATKSPKFGLAALFGWTEGFVGAHYGNPKTEKQLELVQRRFGSYLRRRGVDIPKNPTTVSLTKEDGVFDHVESFLYAYPTQVMNACFTMIGLQYALEGRQKKVNDLVYAGGLLIAGGLAGLLIPEKKPDPDHPPEGTLQKAWSWVQEKPLRVTGTLLTANLAFLAKDALHERRANPGQHSYIFKLLAATGFTFGNAMMAVSPKADSGGSRMDEKSLNELGDISAQVIAAQPKQVQDALLQDVSVFLAEQPYVRLKAEEISELLHKKLAEKVPGMANWQSRSKSDNATTLTM